MATGAKLGFNTGAIGLQPAVACVGISVASQVAAPDRDDIGVACSAPDTSATSLPVRRGVTA